MSKRKATATCASRFKKRLQLQDRADPRYTEDAVAALSYCRNVLVIVGAGISTSAGIPEFRSSRGTFIRHDLRRAFDASTLRYSTDALKEAIDFLAAQAARAEPTPFHEFLGRFDSRLLRLYTQNIDGLEAEVGPADGKVVHLHGSLKEMVCTIRPSHHRPTVTPELWKPCLDCGREQDERKVRGLRHRGCGIMRPRITLYQEDTFADAECDIATVMEQDLRQRPDALLVAGTSLSIDSLRGFVVRDARDISRRGGPTVWVSHNTCPVPHMTYHLNMDCDGFARSMGALPNKLTSHEQVSEDPRDHPSSSTQ
ncbi:hypothetical protein CBER1_09973 [Cercospora berteroae]|uniref:Deacetylase sirtuin-type domain-containing protein n=1 Tax=Cercospora berteroae TaxID=357750 RepID=A0A2S6C601_9PEZI|nr:hypothetical protein CBER1_09973 [Cercospora berteroae]